MDHGKKQSTVHTHYNVQTTKCPAPQGALLHGKGVGRETPWKINIRKYLKYERRSLTPLPHPRREADYRVCAGEG